MDVLRLALIALAIAGIWAIIELALTIRKARSTVETISGQIGEITESANQTIAQTQPIINKVDVMVEDLGPTVQQLGPLVEKATTAVDVVTVDLANVNDILVDVSSVTDTASNVTSTVSKAANSAVSGVAGVVGKFTAGGKGGKGRHSLRRRLKGADEASEGAHVSVEDPEVVVGAMAEPDVEEATQSQTYYTYGSATDASEGR